MNVLVRSFLTMALASVALTGIGCGSDNPGGADGGGMFTLVNPLPLKVGNNWTYKVTDEQGVITEKHQTAMVEELVGGTGVNKDVMAIRMVTTKGVGGTDETISWQKNIGTGVVRYREQSLAAGSLALELEEHWEPHKLRVDVQMDNTKSTSTWLLIYQEFKTPFGATTVQAEARDRWTVIDTSQSVTVPAGTFDAFVVQKAGGGSTKTYWFVSGVGKVKETGGQTEELAAYQVTP